MKEQPQTNHRQIFTHKLQFPEQNIQPENNFLVINNIDYQYKQKNGQQEQRKSQDILKKKKGRRKKIHKDKPDKKSVKQSQKKEVFPTQSIDESSRKLNEDINEHTGRRIINLSKLADTFEENTIEKFYMELQKNYMGRPSKEHIQIIHNKFTELKNLKVNELLNDQIQFNNIAISATTPYPHFLREVSRNSDQISILVTYNNKYLIVYYSIDNNRKIDLLKEKDVKKMLKITGYIDLSEQEYDFLKTREFFMIQLEYQLQGYKKNISKQSVHMSEISKQLLFLNSISKNKQKKLLPFLQNIQNLMKKQLKEKQFDTDTQIIMDCYIHAILAKNIKKALQDFEFAILNYFKLFASIQANKQFVPIENTKDLIEYIKKKKVKKTKKIKYPLATSCIGCFSNFYEQSNPFKNCSQCGSRFHRYCQEISEQICSICQGKKLKRTGGKECIICPKKGLLYKNNSIGTPIHIFCLLAYNYFEIKNRKAILKIPPIKTENPCDICGIQYGILEKCKCVCCQKCEIKCNHYVHLICAYLAGYYVQIRKRGEVHYQCCKYTQHELNKNSFKRKYVSNYEQYAYNYYSEEDFLREKRKDPIDNEIQDKEDIQQRQENQQMEEEIQRDNGELRQQQRSKNQREQIELQLIENKKMEVEEKEKQKQEERQQRQKGEQRDYTNYMKEIKGETGNLNRRQQIQQQQIQNQVRQNDMHIQEYKRFKFEQKQQHGERQNIRFREQELQYKQQSMKRLQMRQVRDKPSQQQQNLDLGDQSQCSQDKIEIEKQQVQQKQKQQQELPYLDSD